MWSKCPYCDEFGISVYDCELCTDCEGVGYQVLGSVAPCSAASAFEVGVVKKASSSEQDDDEEEDSVEVLGEEV